MDQQDCGLDRPARLVADGAGEVAGVGGAQPGYRDRAGEAVHAVDEGVGQGGRGGPARVSPGELQRQRTLQHSQVYRINSLFLIFSQ